MSEVIELSTDDENSIQNNERSDDSDSTVDTDIETILSKYKNVKYDFKVNYQETTKNLCEEFNDDIDFYRNSNKKNNLESISNSSEESDNCRRLKRKLNLNVEKISLENYKVVFDEALKPKKLKTRNNHDDKILKKIQKEQEKTRKQAERQQKMTANAIAKAEKQQLASALKNLTPDECIKFITASVDTELMSSEMGTDIPNILQSASIAYKISPNILPCTLTWTRVNQPQFININQQLTANEDCDEVLLFIMWKDFVTLVQENKLNTDLKLKGSLLFEKRIHLGIYGLENYYRFHKSRKQQITGKEKMYAASPKISRNDVDMALIGLQLLHNISHSFLETPQDVSAMVLRWTKSISQIPYKKHKELKTQQMDWYISGDNKDSVRVDKNGNGLRRLWQQQITQFTMARLETAEAITSVYPSPSALIEDIIGVRKGDHRQLHDN